MKPLQDRTAAHTLSQVNFNGLTLSLIQFSVKESTQPPSVS
jgi:hypothetical protein